MKIHLVNNPPTHHASLSGYSRIGQYLRELTVAEELSSGWEPAPMFGRVWDRLIDRSGMDWYNKRSLGLEIAAGKKLLRGSHEIYHILYGEDTYRYLSSLSTIARRKKSKIVCSYHQPPAVLEKVVRHKEAIRRLDAVIALSSGQADYFASLLRDPSRVFFIRHGIDTVFYHPARQPAGDRIRCLCVGQWLRDYDTLRLAAKRLGERDPRVSFTVITSAERAGSLGGIENLIAVSGLSDQELLRTYQQSDVFVLPLTDCTANNALMEALACGLPAVVTDVGGIKDYITPDCAIAVPPGDSMAMADAIFHLAGNPRLRERMGAQARVRALELDWKHTARTVMNLYQTLGA